MNDAANIQAIRSERLKDLRTSMGISTKALADATGISVGSLNTWENDDATAGKTSTDGIKLENLIKLADFYGVSLDYLAGRTDVKSPSPTLQGVCEYTGLTEKVVEKLNVHVERIKENCGSFFLCGLVVYSNIRKVVVLLLHRAVSCNSFLWP